MSKRSESLQALLEPSSDKYLYFFAVRDKRAFVLLVLRYSVILTAVCVQKILISVAVAAIFFPPFRVGHARYCTCKDYISLWISCYKYLHLAGEELG